MIHTTQVQRVLKLMRDGEWRTLSEIAASTSDPEPSVSGQLRHLRRAGFTVEKRRCERDASGFWEYQVQYPRRR